MEKIGRGVEIMGRKKKENFPNHFMANVLFYDRERINYRHAVIVATDCDTQTYQYMGEHGYMETVPVGQVIHMQTDCYEELNNIELDPTTMKRIAIYNKQQECKRLDKEIKEKQEKIKELDDLLQDKEKRWNKVKEYIKNIYEINLDEEDSDDYYDY